MGYDVEGLQKGWPVEHLPKNPESFQLPLIVFLQHGSLSDLCAAIIDEKIPDPWLTHALTKIPPAAMHAAYATRALKMMEKQNAR